MVLFERDWVLGMLLAQIGSLRGVLMYETPAGFSLSALVVSQVLGKATRLFFKICCD